MDSMDAVVVLKSAKSVVGSVTGGGKQQETPRGVFGGVLCP